MSGVGRLWAWLSRARTRNVLAFLGAGLAALAAALWQVYLHFAPSPPAPRAPPAAEAPLQAAAPASLSAADARRLQASQKRALDAEAGALDKITGQIEAAGNPPNPPAAPHR